MNNLGALHSKMAGLIKKIRSKPNISSPKIKKYIAQLIETCDQYIIAIAYADHISYLEFFNLIDIIEDNINCLQQKYGTIIQI